MGNESARLFNENEVLGADLRGAVAEEERAAPRAEPTRSPKRLGLESAMPMRDEEEDAQLFPKMSPTTDGGGLARSDLAAAAGWWVHDGFPG